MELQVTEAQYAERRRIRVEKMKALRSVKSFIQHVPIPIHQQLSDVSTTRKPRIHSVEEDHVEGHDKAKNRQIKNRESALLSRKRKLEEVSYLHTKVNSLEEEIFRLKSRLRVYEGDAVDVVSVGVLVPNVHDMDTMSIASSESEQSTIITRGRPPSKNRQYYKSVSKLRNASSVASVIVPSSSGYYPIQNKQMLSHLEPAVFDF